MFGDSKPLLADPRPSSPEKGDANLIPLINVVFLILVFFMIAGQIRAQDSLEISPPVSSSEQLPAECPELLLSADGQLATDEGMLQYEQLAKWIHRQLEQNPDGLLRLRADENVTAALLQQVLDVLREQRVTEIELVTRVAES